MNRDNNILNQPNWRKEIMEEIRANIDSNQNKEAMDALYRDINAASHKEVGEDMLDLLIDQVQKGVDIAQKFPELYQILLEDQELQQEFVDILELLEVDSDALPEFSKPEKSELSFLKTASSFPKIQFSSLSQWMIELRQELSVLQSLFSPAELGTTHRSAMPDSQWVSLLRKEIALEGATVDVGLDAVVSDQQEEALELLLKAVVMSEEDDELIPINLAAEITWGEYRQECFLGDKNRIKFPLVRFEQILDEKKEQVAADLNLVLRSD